MSVEKELMDRVKASGTLMKRLYECRSRIGAMCSEGRPPKMTIPTSWCDDDFFITTTLQEAREEIERLTQWVADMQAGCTVNCVYCGHRYGPDPGTPTSQADVLKAHVEQCERHPMFALKRRCAELESQLNAIRKALREGSAN